MLSVEMKWELSAKVGFLSVLILFSLAVAVQKFRLTRGFCFFQIHMKKLSPPPCLV